MTAVAGPSTGSGTAGGRGAGLWIGIGLAVLAIIALLVLSARTPAGDPFDPRSAAPDGYKAITILLRDQGVQVGRASAATVAGRELGAGDVVIVPIPSFASESQLDAFEEAARGGATVVYGEPVGAGSDDVFSDYGGFLIDGRTLADTPAFPVEQDVCDIAELDGLGDIDAAFVPSFDVRDSGNERRDGETCYGDQQFATIQSRLVGDGRVVTIGSPYLWANARLQPDKEEGGGQPLDNAATALRLFGDAETITMVDAHVSSGVTVGGTQNPVQLLPLPVKLALVQLVAAFGIFVWWRSRRLGPPLTETMPVEIAGSELVVAVGELLRRKGNPDRAAVVLRAETRRVLGSRLGIPPNAPLGALVTVVADRSGRDPVEVGAALADSHIPDSESLVRLARTLDTLRQEVLDVVPHR